MVPETCPAIDKAAAEFRRDVDEFVSASLDDFVSASLDDFVETIVKKQTASLRDALVQALSDKHDAEARAEKLEDQVADLEKEVARLNKEISRMEAEIA